MTMSLSKRVLPAILLLASCRGEATGPPAPDGGAAAFDASSSAPAPAPSGAAAARPRTPMRGDDFPDGVLALTWDDGPDAHTLELARYLRDERVPATFFVVGAWLEGVSEEPGVGAKRFATGYEHIAIDELSRLGHRVGAHARHHRLLHRATAEIMREELGTAPFVADRLRFFRAPAGAWSDASKAAIAQRAFADLIGPIHWDIDAKDWECSLYCRSDAPAADCEPGPIPGERRVKPAVVADRYLARVEASRRGIVLLHDRVGDVGSTYALDVARRLVPALKQRRYVFGPPVLAFGPLTPRAGARAGAPGPLADVHRADLNGDGIVDECVSTPRGVECALGDGEAYKDASVWSREVLPRFTLADVNGDGHADLCSADRCALAP